MSLVELAWPLRTERLVLRPATPADLDAVWAVRRQPEVYRWLPTAAEDREAFVAAADDAWFARSLVVEHDGAVVGDLMLRVTDAWAQAEVREAGARKQGEIGYVVDPAYAGRGLASEAVRALLAVGFAAPPEGLGLHRVVATCFADNTPSWRLMERVGMRREAHTVRDALHRTDGWLDGYDYALLHDEWRAE